MRAWTPVALVAALGLPACGGSGETTPIGAGGSASAGTGGAASGGSPSKGSAGAASGGTGGVASGGTGGAASGGTGGAASQFVDFACQTTDGMMCTFFRGPATGLPLQTSTCMESSGTPLEACLAGAAGACAMSETITQFYYIDNIEALMALETVCTDGGGIWISSPE